MRACRLRVLSLAELPKFHDMTNGALILKDQEEFSQKLSLQLFDRSFHIDEVTRHCSLRDTGIDNAFQSSWYGGLKQNVTQLSARIEHESQFASFDLSTLLTSSGGLLLTGHFPTSDASPSQSTPHLNRVTHASLSSRIRSVKLVIFLLAPGAALKERIDQAEREVQGSVVASTLRL